MATVDVQAYIGVVFPLLIVLSFILVLIYAETGFPWHSYITLVIGYFSSFAILFLVPIDIASIIIARRSTASVADSGYNSYVSQISTAYSTLFTLVLIFGSVILVFEEYYNTDGYFTILSKLWSSFKRWLFDTILGLIAGVVILGILIGQHVVSNNSAALQLAAVLVTNTLYETMLMFLLGYGIVEFPRSIWQNSDLERYHLKTQNKAAYEFKNISDAQLEVSLVVADVYKTKEQLASYANQQLNDAMTVILSECPTEFKSSRQGTVATNKSGQVTIDSLALLRTRLNIAKDRYRMAQATSLGTKLKAYYLEDVVAAKIKGEGKIFWSLQQKESSRNEYYWHCIVWPYILKFTAFVIFSLSVLTFVGVISATRGVSTAKTPYFLAIHSETASSAGIVIFIFFTLGYTSYVTLWALFQMKLVGFVELVPGRTTPEALSFNVRMCARLAAPLAFFYLGWIAEDGLKNGYWTQSSTAPTFVYENVTYFNSTTGTSSTLLELVPINNQIVMASAFSNFYQLQNIGFIKRSFSTIFPVIFYCVVGLILPNFLNRLFVLMKLPNMQFGDQIVTEEQLREGKRLLERNKAQTARTFQRGLLRDYIANLAKRNDESESTPGLLSGIMAKFRSKKPETKPEAGPILVEPEGLSGLLEKKGSSSFGIGGNWQEVFAEIEPPKTLIFKDKKTHNKESSVDLSTIISFNDHKQPKESNQLDLVLSTTTLFLKFKSEEDQVFWKNSLIKWKDYAVDYATFYPEERSASSGVISASIPATDTRGSGSRGQGLSSAKPVDAMAELDNIVVEDEEEDSPSKVSKPLIKSFMGFGKKAKVEEKPSRPVDIKPSPLEGWLEKKSGAKVQLGSDWQKRYVRINERTMSLDYFKTSAQGEKASGSLDLRLSVNIAPYDKGAGKTDASRFNIEFGEGEKVYKFKAPSTTEGERWVSALNEWRDYFLLHSV